MNPFAKLNEVYSFLYTKFSELEVKNSRNIKVKIAMQPQEFSTNICPQFIFMKESGSSPQIEADQLLLRLPKSFSFSLRAIDYSMSSLTKADIETEAILSAYLEHLGALIKEEGYIRERIKDTEISGITWDFEGKEGAWYSAPVAVFSFKLKGG